MTGTGRSLPIARGVEQHYRWEQMLAGRAVHLPSRELRGAASAYAGRYDGAFFAMLRRADAAGYLIDRAFGPRGGRSSATYWIVGFTGA